MSDECEINMSDNNTPKKINYPFTVDSDVTQEMPSIARLLNRKAFKFSEPTEITQTLKAPGYSLPDPRRALEPNSTKGSIPQSGPAVQPATQRNRRSSERLSV